ncbi:MULTISPECIES: DUF881 domain-containing protein [unclassified Rhodococcus (in: high G+C Gram-positive bacteria)]|uniref:DUF881 domain-containing protein n=1 Tax=unclassified Rhodococcus (in: high G+C Gram-positive bacteria) TaxID=192944 RepID=UPI00339287D7
MRKPPTRNPTPSLLKSLMSEHLDPGYAAASANKSSRSTRSPMDVVLAIVGVVLIGSVFGVALSRVDVLRSDASGQAPDLVETVREAESRSDAMERTRSTLAGEVESARSSVLQSDKDGASILNSLRNIESAAGAETSSGAGIAVVVTEPPASANLSDVSQKKRGSSAATVLDRDLQVVVNSLWASGAEAIAVDGIRIGPNVTIRQAGGAMLVDNHPVFSPYAIDAIGSPEQLQVRFAVSDAHLRMSALTQLYDVGFDVRSEDSLELPAAAVRTAPRVQQEGGR